MAAFFDLFAIGEGRGPGQRNSGALRTAKKEAGAKDE
jgi:hypothetical protein